MNVIYTCIGETFETWVKRQVFDRNDKIVRDSYIELDPDVATAF